jgi:hypothetical protein
MKNVAILLIVISCINSVYAQSTIPPNMRSQFTMDRLIDRDGLGRTEQLYGIPQEPGRVVGDTYFDKKWNIARMMLFEKEKIIEGFYMRYDIKLDVVEINSDKGVKVLDVRRVKSIAWIDSLSNAQRFFINGRLFQLSGTPLTGFLEVIVDGKMPLIRRMTIIEKNPDYIPAFDMGSRDVRMLKKDIFYYPVGKELNKIGSKKSLIAAFGDYAKDVESYIKINKLDIDDERHLASIFEYYNSKFPTAAN